MIQPRRRGAARFTLVLAALLMALVVAAAPVSAQDWRGRGRVRGQVKDESDQPIAGAQITLVRPDLDNGGPEPVLTGEDGKFSIFGLRGGDWAMQVSKEGYQTQPISINVSNDPGRTPSVEVVLHPDPAALRAMWVESGNEAFRKGDYAAARGQYQKVLEQMPPEQQAPVLRGIAQTYMSEGNQDQAIQILQQALARSPSDPQTLKLMARVRYDQGEADQSIELLQKALEGAPQDPEILNLLINVLGLAGREEEAEEYMAMLPDESAVDPNIVLNIGIDLYNAGELDEALERFDRVVSVHPDNADAHYFRGMVYLAQQKNDEALADFHKMLELAPDHPNAAEARQFVEYLESEQKKAGQQ